MTLFSDLHNFMQSKGLPCENELYADDVIHRYSSRHGKDRDEWYIIREIEADKYICIFGSWREEGMHIWRSYGEPSDDEEDRLQEINLKVWKEQEEEEKKQQEIIRPFFEKASICVKHPYLERKKIQPHNTRIHGDWLVIPLYNVNNELSSLQYINGNGTKRFKKGISTKNLFHVIGDIKKSSQYVICEGFATGASIHEHTKLPVIVAFSASNCVVVGKYFNYLYPKKKPILAADNDKAGLNVVEDWKKYVDTLYVIPEKAGEDFNDWYNRGEVEKINQLFLPEHITALNIREILEEDIPREEWINSIITKGSFNIIYGDAGLGKSRISYELALCIAINKRFLFWEPRGAFKCLYVDGEMSAWDIKSRVQEMIERYEDDLVLDEENYRIIKTTDMVRNDGDYIDLYEERSRKRLDKEIKKADVIFLDNFGCLTIPQGGDNYKKDLIKWVETFRWMKDWMMAGKTFVMIMHSTKEEKLEGVKRIKNDATLVVKLVKPMMQETAGLHLHTNLYFDKVRKLSLEDQQPFSFKLYKDLTQKNFNGWKSEKL